MRFPNEAKALVAVANRFLLGDTPEEVDVAVDAWLCQFAAQFDVEVSNVEHHFDAVLLRQSKHVILGKHTG